MYCYTYQFNDLQSITMVWEMSFPKFGNNIKPRSFSKDRLFLVLLFLLFKLLTHFNLNVPSAHL